MKMRKWLILLLAAVLAAAWALPAAGAEGEWQEPLSEDEIAQLFAYLSETPLTASSGAGAWEGSLQVNADGSFTGSYTDADADVVYSVEFSGNFNFFGTERWGNSTYALWVENLTTRNVPGTKAPGEYGETIEYVDAPISDREYLRLTLPGTRNDEIPEIVQGEIGGTWDEWEDFSRFITLTRTDDGWGFFAEPARGWTYTPAPAAQPQPEPQPQPEQQPQPETPPAGAESAWTGYWKAMAELSEMTITDNGDGTFHAEVFFLKTLNMHATLKPQGDGSLFFETDYGALTGTLTMESGGKMRLQLSGGYSFYDEEASEFNDYYAQPFVYSPATYAEMWYEDPSVDMPKSDDDWLGTWEAHEDYSQGRIVIERSGDGFRATISLNTDVSYSGWLEKESDTVMSLYGDTFSCMFRLNRKLDVLVMEEVGAESEAVYTWLYPFPCSIAEFRRPGAPVPGNPAEEPDEAPEAGGDGAQEGTEDGGYPYAGGTPQDFPEVPGYPGVLQVIPSRVYATSYIVGSKDASAYVPEKMTDGNENTSFQFSTKATPPGKEFLFFDFDEPVTLDGIWMKNGSWKNGDTEQFTRNCRIKTMTVAVLLPGSTEYRDLLVLTPEDRGPGNEWDMLELYGADGVIGVRIRVDEIYTGTKFKNDVCITELMFVQAATE